MHFSGSATGGPPDPPAGNATALASAAAGNQGCCTAGRSMKVATSPLRNTRCVAL
jgi:hypothetical protein